MQQGNNNSSNKNLEHMDSALEKMEEALHLSRLLCAATEGPEEKHILVGARLIYEKINEALEAANAVSENSAC